MSEEFCAGVKILLSRVKSNPEEFANNGKWSTIISEVFATCQNSNEAIRGRSRVIRALTAAEIQALYVEFKALDRAAFDAYVMESVLEGNHEGHHLSKPQYSTPEQSAALVDHIHTHRGLMAQNAVSWSYPPSPEKHAVKEARKLGLGDAIIAKIKNL